jgi:hypothetical protein
MLAQELTLLTCAREVSGSNLGWTPPVLVRDSCDFPRSNQITSSEPIRHELLSSQLRGYAVAYLIEALYYKQEGRGFDSQ